MNNMKLLVLLLVLVALEQVITNDRDKSLLDRVYGALVYVNLAHNLD